MRSNVIQLRKRPYTEVEDYQWIDALPEEDDIVDRIDDMIELLKTPDHALMEALAKLEAAVTLKEVSEEAPLRLEDAVCLPELGGSYTADPALRTPSETVSIKMLRRAITDGKLAVIRPNSKNLYVCRKDIKEWLTNCRDQGNPFSSSCNLTATRMASSRTRPNGISGTMESQSSLAAGRMMLEKLRNS